MSHSHQIFATICRRSEQKLFNTLKTSGLLSKWSRPQHEFSQRTINFSMKTTSFLYYGWVAQVIWKQNSDMNINFNIVELLLRQAHSASIFLSWYYFNWHSVDYYVRLWVNTFCLCFNLFFFFFSGCGRWLIRNESNKRARTI